MIEHFTISADTYADLAEKIRAEEAQGWRCAERKFDRTLQIWIAKLTRNRDDKAPKQTEETAA